MHKVHHLQFDTHSYYLNSGVSLPRHVKLVFLKWAESLTFGITIFGIKMMVFLNQTCLLLNKISFCSQRYLWLEQTLKLFKNLTLNSKTLIWLTLIFRLSTDVGDWQQQEQSSKFEKAHSLTIPNSQYVCMWYIVQLHYHQLGTFRDAQC